ncbi:MAG: geranylgeranylglycerol-phosphate geranylgeranyltransferase [Flavobacteriales bacterium]|nr:geranylgeranylglycerol-phosphate geranylgeranyltransferase [Flavobacteriales bacterium]
MNPILAFLKLIRLPNLLIIVLTQYVVRYAIINPFLAVNLIPLKLTDFQFFLLSLTTVMIAAAGYIINDYFDTKIDRINRPNEVIVGKYIKRRWAMGSHIVINGIALLLAVYLARLVDNYKLVLIQLFSVGALWYYSVSFKKQVIIGNILVALLTAMVPLVAGLYELLLQYRFADETVNLFLFSLDEGTKFDDAYYIFNQILVNCWKWIIGFSLFAFVSNFAREVIKDLEDYEGDLACNCQTLPVVKGIDFAKRIAQIILAIMIILLGTLQYLQWISNDITSFIYFLFALQLPSIFIIYKLQSATAKNDFSFLSKYTKVLMFLGIIYMFLFAYIVLKSQ